MARLVRDKVPEIYQKEGRAVVARVASDAEFRELLKQKLKQEAAEFAFADDIGELATAAEVIDEILKCRGVGKDEFEELRKRKNEEKGTFSKRIVVEELK